jgi:membrane protein required for colicin V production
MIEFFSQPVFLALTRFDLVVLGMCVLLGVRGFFRGLVRDVIFVAGMVLAVVAARMAGPQAAAVLSHFMNPASASFAGAALIFLCIFAGACVAAGLAHNFIKLAQLTWLDRSLGFAFWVFAMLAVTGVIARLATLHFPPLGGLMSHAYVTRLSMVAMQWVMGA